MACKVCAADSLRRMSVGVTVAGRALLAFVLAAVLAAPAGAAEPASGSVSLAEPFVDLERAGQRLGVGAGEPAADAVGAADRVRGAILRHVHAARRRAGGSRGREQLVCEPTHAAG